MLHQRKSTDISSQEINLAIGHDQKAFLIKYNSLRTKWLKWIETMGDSNEGRLISTTLFQKATPINFSIISDNLQYFETHYPKDQGNEKNLYKALKVACLLGSREIGEFLLNKLEINFTSQDNDFVFSYACASTNKDWVMDLARKMKEAGREIPNGVYLFCNDTDLLETIKKIFKSQQVKSNFI